MCEVFFPFNNSVVWVCCLGTEKQIFKQGLMRVTKYNYKYIKLCVLETSKTNLWDKDANRLYLYQSNAANKYNRKKTDV